MRVERITFSENEQPAEITVTMSLAEAADIAQGLRCPGAYNALTAMVFNAYWDDGIAEYRREQPEAGRG